LNEFDIGKTFGSKLNCLVETVLPAVGDIHHFNDFALQSLLQREGKQRNISLYEKEGKCNAVVPKYPIYEAKSHKPTHNEKCK